MRACGKHLVYRNLARSCSLPDGHVGPCRTWVEQADLDNEPRLWREPDEVEAQGLTR